MRSAYDVLMLAYEIEKNQWRKIEYFSLIYNERISCDFYLGNYGYYRIKNLETGKDDVFEYEIQNFMDVLDVKHTRHPESKTIGQLLKETNEIDIFIQMEEIFADVSYRPFKRIDWERL